MKWFGGDWGAPICAPADHIPTPVGMNCLYCPEVIREDDQGFAMDYFAREDDGWLVTTGYAHRKCLISAILGPGWVFSG